MIAFEDYKNNIKKVIFEVLIKHTDISRIGIAINYYIDKKDEKYSYWIKKYNLPFYDSSSTSEVSYTINNNFIYKGLKFNKILILSNGKVSNTKTVPIVSIDVNNLPTPKINESIINYIFEEMNYYKKEEVESHILNEK